MNDFPGYFLPDSTVVVGVSGKCGKQEDAPLEFNLQGLMGNLIVLIILNHVR